MPQSFRRPALAAGPPFPSRTDKPPPAPLHWLLHTLRHQWLAILVLLLGLSLNACLALAYHQEVRSEWHARVNSDARERTRLLRNEIESCFASLSALLPLPPVQSAAQFRLATHPLEFHSSKVRAWALAQRKGSQWRIAYATTGATALFRIGGSNGAAMLAMLNHLGQQSDGRALSRPIVTTQGNAIYIGAASTADRALLGIVNLSAMVHNAAAAHTASDLRPLVKIGPTLDEAVALNEDLPPVETTVLQLSTALPLVDQVLAVDWQVGSHYGGGPDTHWGWILGIGWGITLGATASLWRRRTAQQRTEALADAAALHQAAERSARERQCLLGLLDRAPIGCCVAVEGRLHFVNRRLQDRLGLQTGDSLAPCFVQADEYARMHQQPACAGPPDAWAAQLFDSQHQAIDALLACMPCDWNGQPGVLCWIMEPPPQSAPPPCGHVPAPPELPPVAADSEGTVTQLKKMLWLDDPNTIALWDANASLLQTLLPHAAKIEAAIRGFDFEHALRLLNEPAPARGH